VDRAADKVQQGADQAVNKAQEVWDNVTGQATDAKDQASNKAQQTADQVSHSAQRGVDSAKETASNQDLGGKAEEAKSGVQRAFDSAADVLEHGLSRSGRMNDQAQDPTNVIKEEKKNY
jgi:vacuolar-type H+-ATPase subunit E/Vma4